MPLVGCCSLVLGIFGCPSCDLDAISIGGMEFCYLEFCFNSVFWSCHPVPVDPSGDCIRVLCWDELLFVACLACFGCSVLSIFGFQVSALVLHQIH